MTETRANQSSDNDNKLAQQFNTKKLFGFALPPTIVLIFTSMYTMVDGMFVSQLIGTDALAAVNIVYPLISMIIAIGVMFGTGGSAIIGKLMGEGDNKRANGLFSFIIIYNLIIGLIIMAILTIFVDDIVVIMGANDQLFEYARDYLFAMALFAPLALLQMVTTTLITTAGKPVFGLVLALGGGVINMVLDYVLIACAGMGIQGAGLATGTGLLVPSVFGLAYFLFNKKGTLKLRVPRASIRDFVKTMTNGSSEMVTNMSIALTTLIFNILMMKLAGEDGVAAVTIVLYMQFLLTSIFMGYIGGIAPIISFKYGARDVVQQKLIFKISLVFIVLASVTVFIFAESMAHPLILIFAKSGTNVYDIAVKGFHIFSVSFLFAGINIFASGYFTALSNGAVSASISFLRTLGFMLISFIVLPRLFGIIGVWLAVPVAELLTIVASVGFLVKNRNKYGYTLDKSAVNMHRLYKRS